MELILFLTLALAAIVTAVLVVTQKNPVNSVLFLVVTFFCQAVLYVMLGAQFIAALQVIVYAGAIMVLFVFVLMLLDLKGPQHWEVTGTLRKWLGFIVSGAVFLVAVTALTGTFDANAALDPEMGSAKNVGKELFTRFLLPFEIASILLLAAIVGVVAMLKRESVTSKKSTGEGAET